MTSAEKQPTKAMPKGGRKGGTRYPRIALQKALDYSKKLVSKTHVAPHPEDEILPSVFGNSGSEGKIRASALKQFGLLQGDTKAYEATTLAKEIEAALPESRSALVRQAFLKSEPLNKIFDTFHGDTISKAQIVRRVKELDVHPDLADECAQIFLESALTAELGTLSGDALALVPATLDTATSTGDEDQNPASNEHVTGDRDHAEKTVRVPPQGAVTQQSKPGLSVNLNVDSSSDPDKLEKQLKLLRDFGVI
jgi:hypothetical protein